VVEGIEARRGGRSHKHTQLESRTVLYLQLPGGRDIATARERRHTGGASKWHGHISIVMCGNKSEARGRLLHRVRPHNQQHCWQLARLHHQKTPV
jgi:hypothetical protein